MHTRHARSELQRVTSLTSEPGCTATFQVHIPILRIHECIDEAKLINTSMAGDAG